MRKSGAVEKPKGTPSDNFLGKGKYGLDGGKGMGQRYLQSLPAIL